MTILKHKFPPNLSSIYDEELANQLANTQAAITALEQLRHILHNPTLLMRPILAKEAESSAQLEGSQSSVEDAYKVDVVEQTTEKRNESLEIKNYQDAMLKGLQMVNDTRLNETTIGQIQKLVTQGVRGKEKHPGRYRTGDIWVGDLGTSKEEARYVAPAAAFVKPLMNGLASFMKSSESINPLVACAVIHHRFEAIHAFEDGNGRTGRILITLYLIERGLFSLPILYPSGYFERNRKQYINNLSFVDKEERWRPWIMFFLRGMEEQANLSLELGTKINELYQEAKKALEDDKKSSLHLMKVLDHTFVKPYFTIPAFSEDLNIHRVTCSRYVKKLKEKGIIALVGDFKRANVYVNLRLIRILRKI